MCAHTFSYLKQSNLKKIVLFSEAKKKLCKKVKVLPEEGQYILKHYHNGEFSKDYDRAIKVTSLVNFMRDPTGDLPWDEDEAAQDITHLPDNVVSFIMGYFMLNSEKLVTYIYQVILYD